MNFEFSGISSEEIKKYEQIVKEKHDQLHYKNGKGSEFTGWVEYDKAIDKEEIKKIKKVATEIMDNTNILLVVGIGGSYLGSKAVIEALNNTFYNESLKTKIYFVGQNISGTYLSDLMDIIKTKDIYINVISKSGTTTEPAIAFRILRDYVIKKYGRKEAARKIIVTTDSKHGALKILADKEGYRTFIIPDNIGGRYSVFTPAGLLPIACTGIDIDKLLAGVNEGVNEYNNNDLLNNEAYKYAVIRNILLKKGKNIEILVNYEPKFLAFAEWFKQLFGESEGKEKKGIYPSSALFSTDLHSIGQYIQEGQNVLFETVISIDKPKRDIVIFEDDLNLDGLNFLAEKKMSFVNKMAMKGTILAHVEAKVPNIIIEAKELNEFYIGKLMYFFMKACAMSGYILGVNPFDQPGVESYKRNMFALIGKPGFEELRKKLLNE